MIDPNALSRARLFEYLRSLIIKLDELEAGEDALDWLVHDTAAEQATEVNNSGRPSQLEYLLKHGWSEDQIMERVKKRL